ncbi:metallophosphoesterase [Blastococcus sp. SYSU DS0973]
MSHELNFPDSSPIDGCNLCCWGPVSRTFRFRCHPSGGSERQRRGIGPVAHRSVPSGARPLACTHSFKGARHRKRSVRPLGLRAFSTAVRLLAAAALVVAGFSVAVPSRPAAAPSRPAAAPEGLAAAPEGLAAAPEGLAAAPEGLAAAPEGLAADPVLVAAGDIGCAPGRARTSDSCRYGDTADLIGALQPDAVLPLGDQMHDDASLPAYQTVYDPSWGRHRSISHPIPGNHEYATDAASGYYDYFGTAAGERSKGYYSWDIGAWHIIALNSECSYVGGCGAGSPQEQWLRADLAAHPNRCTLAYWHRPMFSSAGGDTRLKAFWQALEEFGADIVLSGHNHIYERFAPQSSGGVVNPQGPRQFVVGTGGSTLVSASTPAPNREVGQSSTFGVLRLALHESSYDYNFVPVAGSSWTDGGSINCHSASPPSVPSVDGA